MSVCHAPPGTEVEAVSSTAIWPRPWPWLPRTPTSRSWRRHQPTSHRRSTSQTKIKKSADGGLELKLVQTTDVLAGLVAARTDARQILVGFAAETPSAGETLLDLGRAKLARKGCDLLVLNEVGHNLVFGQPHSQITLLTAEGATGPIHREQGHACASHLGRGPGPAGTPVGSPLMARRLFTSESVTEGHPDKIADQISDSVLDELLRQDPNSRVAVEMSGDDGARCGGRRGHHRVVRGDPRVVRERIIDIGYDSSTKGFDGGSCGVTIAIGQQSPDIAQGVDVAFESRTGESTDVLDLQGAGDQGLMFGYACSETPSLMPLPIDLAHRLAEQLAAVRKDGTMPYLRPDGKTQVTIEYDGDRPVRVDTVVLLDPACRRHRPRGAAGARRPQTCRRPDPGALSGRRRRTTGCW